MYRIGIIATHPIQYYAPLYGTLAGRPDVDLTVFYCLGYADEGQPDRGFGTRICWGRPLLDGYRYKILGNIARIKDAERFSGCDTPEITDIIHAESYDGFIVHGWQVKSYWQAMRACRASGTPLLVRGDSYLPADKLFLKKWVKYPFYRRLMAGFDAFLVVGKRAREYYRYYGADEKKMFFSPHAVDNDFFESKHKALMPQRAGLRRKWGIPESATVFLFAGKLIPKKRPLDFIKAMGLCGADRARGLIVGEGRLRAECEKAARKISGKIIFTGFLDQNRMPEAYAVSDVIVMPSGKGETWALAVNEAMISGLPAVVSDKVGCGPDLVTPGETGHVFPCGDVKGLSRILGALSSDPAAAGTMGNMAEARAREYSPEKAADGIIQAMRSIRERRSGYA
ncbi:MAG: glycosyltransferase family 4 protein [Candidatus Omnitrophota bacterium]